MITPPSRLGRKRGVLPDDRAEDWSVKRIDLEKRDEDPSTPYLGMIWVLR